MKENNSPKDIKQKDYITNKLLLVFTIAFALLLLFMIVGRMLKSTTTFLTAITLMRVVTFVALAAFVLGLVLHFSARAKGKNIKYVLFCGKNLAIVSLFIAICAGAFSLVSSADMLTLLYIFVPATVVLYIVYYCYQREFFMIATSSVIGGVGIWLMQADLLNSKTVLIMSCVAAAMIILAVLTGIAHARGGKIKLGNREFSLYSPDARYGIVYLTFVLVLALVAAAFLAPDIAIYFVFGLIGYIVLTGIYYTVKLI